jgi:hypothetical protein
MKARVKATGEIIELSDLEYDVYGNDYLKTELEITDEPDYWEKLKHQYAGMAMQGILANPETAALDDIDVVETAIRIANITIEKLKKKSQCEK